MNKNLRNFIGLPGNSGDTILEFIMPCPAFDCIYNSSNKDDKTMRTNMYF